MNGNNNNNNNSSDNKYAIVIGHEEMKDNCDFEWNLHIYKNTTIQYLDISKPIMNQATSPPNTNNTIVSCLDLDEIDIYAEFKAQEIPYDADTFTFLTKYLLFKQTVTADERDKLKQENYVCLVLLHLFVCCLVILESY